MKTTKCETCGGSGWAQDARWREWWAGWEAHRKAMRDAKVACSLATYQSSNPLPADASGHVCPEECPCQQCEGEGQVPEVWAKLSAAGYCVPTRPLSMAAPPPAHSPKSTARGSDMSRVYMRRWTLKAFHQKYVRAGVRPAPITCVNLLNAGSGVLGCYQPHCNFRADGAWLTLQGRARNAGKFTRRQVIDEACRDFDAVLARYYQIEPGLPAGLGVSW